MDGTKRSAFHATKTRPFGSRDVGRCGRFPGLDRANAAGCARPWCGRPGRRRCCRSASHKRDPFPTRARRRPGLRGSRVAQGDNGRPHPEVQVNFRRFVARLGASRDLLLPIPAGSRLELTGVYAGRGMDLTPIAQFDSCEMLLGSPADVRVLARPAWWTWQRWLVLVLSLVAVIGAACFGSGICGARFRNGPRVCAKRCASESRQSTNVRWPRNAPGLPAICTTTWVAPSRRSPCWRHPRPGRWLTAQSPTSSAE